MLRLFQNMLCFGVPTAFRCLSYGLPACLLASFVLASAQAQEVAVPPRRDQAQTLQREGNYKDALAIYERLLHGEFWQPGESLAQDLSAAISCLINLQHVEASDALIERVLAKHEHTWQLLREAARQYRTLGSNGYLQAGAFVRGYPRAGQVQMLSSAARDRVRALQLLLKALKEARAQGASAAGGILYRELAETLLASAPWKLQALTHLDTLPEYDEQLYFGYHESQNEGAPVTAEGQPIFYSVPSSFEAARSDGERWRWALQQAAQLSPSFADWARLQLAQFLNSQFGVQTFAGTLQRSGDEGSSEGAHDESATGVFALHTLGENETIARLASGVQRFTLPEEFNFLAHYAALAERKGDYQQIAIDALAQIYSDRRQYARSASLWKQGVALFGAGGASFRQKKLDQIVGAWGRFEPHMSQPAGAGASLEFRFRNATSVEFEAHHIDLEKLLSDTQEYLRQNPRTFDYQKLEVEDIGQRLLERDQAQYVAGKAATWSLKLKPAPQHFDRSVTIETPLKRAGAYLLTARVAGGTSSRTIVWLKDLAIVHKHLDAGALYYVADALTGTPLVDAELEFFGYRQESIAKHEFSGRPYNIITSRIRGRSDAQGQYRAQGSSTLDSRFQWLVIARRQGKLGYLGFNSVWHSRHNDSQYQQRKIYSITDRPVYRPGHSVQFKIWLRQARYDQEGEEPNAGRSVLIEVLNPRSEKMLEKQVNLDRFGGYDTAFELPKDAALGVYSITIVGEGAAGSFRVEEYKKPEFEVRVETPSTPQMLGERIKASISARYYFGAPVSKAKLHYKVQRFEHAAQWYPRADWDWLYGQGYWWFASNYDWYPGWRLWGCARPFPWWHWSGQSLPPELVQERTLELGPDGKVEVLIDTLLAKELHGDSDQRYEISAEVTDESRRMISATSSVLVARQPFKVYAWVDRGHYRAGETIRASFSASTIERKPVQGEGQLRLLAISYNENGVPQERTVQEWSLATDIEGRAEQKITAAQPGQYRLSYTVRDTAGHSIEGGYVLSVLGSAKETEDSGEKFRFNEIELIPDKREYAPGERVKLQVLSAQDNAHVLLFLRPANGVYRAPQLLHLQGKSALHELEVSRADMPNFYIEALTVHNGQVFQETKEIVVPPKERVLNVALLTSAEIFQPNQEVSVQLKVTDSAGKPFSGSAVLAVYDSALEYISGGSNVPEIREFFWKWRRQHRPAFQSNLMRYFYQLLLPGEQGMLDIGAHGDVLGLEGLESRASGGVAAAPMGQSLRSGKREMLKQARTDSFEAGAAAPAVLADLADSEPEAAAAPSMPSDTAQNIVRKEFADTAFWQAAIDVPESGVVDLKFKLPENLGSWKLRSWVMGTGTRVGEGSAEIITAKDVILRLQAPRFLVEKDQALLSANVHNFLPVAGTFRVRLELSGAELELQQPAEQVVSIAAGAEVRVDWKVRVTQEGQARVRMLALGEQESDAMEVQIPVYVHGAQKTESFSGVLRGASRIISFTIPAERRPAQTRLELRYSPTLAGAMLDALPYLVNYPYGCTEQTLNRFLPTAIAAKMLRDTGVDLDQLKRKRSNLNAQELGDAAQRATRWQQYDRQPVYDQAEVKRMLRAGLERLASMQLADGGWGWFSGSGEVSTAHTTAYVLHGLQVAKANAIAVDRKLLDRGLAWLEHYEASELQRLRNAAHKTEPWKAQADNLNAFVHMVLLDASRGDPGMRELLYRDRHQLSVYAKSMLGLIFYSAGDKDKLTMLLKNIEQYLVRDAENQTAYLQLGAEGYWWYWYGSEFEAHAYYLKLLTRADPQGEVAAAIVKYLLNNRKHGNYWNSTRDTALIVEAFADYLKATGEQSPDLKLALLLDGTPLKEVSINRDNLFSFEDSLLLEGDALTTGQHTLELRRQGRGPVYYSAYLTNFSVQDPIERAGLEIKINRTYYKLVPEQGMELVRAARGQALSQSVAKLQRERIENLGGLTSGDEVEVELVLESKNDYEYILFEDLKPAGFEPLEVRSGYNGNALGAYVEFRDERVAFFVRTLPRGARTISYRLRAETPGRYSALPAQVSAMYAPELRGNSDEFKVVVGESMRDPG